MKKSYFLISVSNRKNLDLCIKYNLAGFTNSISGIWTFLEVEKGDYISFLYGAKAYNLYIVNRKEAINEAKTMPPWEPITFRQSGRTYYFPFRLYLNPVRKFEESLVRAEFAYVAENLLLRGGYRKPHFQADQTTLQAASQMGNLWNGYKEELQLPNHLSFVPKFTLRRESQRIPEVFQFHEFILQALIRRYLCDDKNLHQLLSQIGIKNIPCEKLEILGEKAFPEGLVDILIKEAVPVGMSKKIIAEVKTSAAQKQDIEQLSTYRREIERECVATILIAKEISQALVREAQKSQIRLIRYTFNGLNENSLYTFEDLLTRLHLQVVNV